MNKKPIIKIHRYWQDQNQSSGICTVLDGITQYPLFSSLSLERGWRGNKKRVSCIPIGIYKVVLEYSPKFDAYLWEIKGVDGRSECKFHVANLYTQLEGCVALGLRPKKINSDKYSDISNSKVTLKAFHLALKGYKEAVLVITGEDKIY